VATGYVPSTAQSARSVRSSFVAPTSSCFLLFHCKALFLAELALPRSQSAGEAHPAMARRQPSDVQLSKGKTEARDSPQALFGPLTAAGLPLRFRLSLLRAGTVPPVARVQYPRPGEEVRPQLGSAGRAHPCRLEEAGYDVGCRTLELLCWRDKASRRETRLQGILQFVHTNVWRSLFGRARARSAAALFPLTRRSPPTRWRSTRMTSTSSATKTCW